MKSAEQEKKTKQQRIEEYLAGKPSTYKEIFQDIGLVIDTKYLRNGRISCIGPHKHQVYYFPKDRKLACERLKASLGIEELEPPIIVLEKLVESKPMLRSELIDTACAVYKNPKTDYKLRNRAELWETLSFLVLEEHVLREVPAHPWQILNSSEYVVYKPGQENKVARLLLKDFPRNPGWSERHNLVLKRKLPMEIYKPFCKMMLARAKKQNT